MINLIEVNYNQTAQSKKTNHLGMREMQQMLFHVQIGHINFV